MPIHKVLQGECLASIAKQYGFAEWKAVYHHPENKDLRSRRKNPNVLHPGDQVFIPEIRPKVAARSTDSTHKFVLKSVTAKLRLVLKDQDGVAMPNKKYKLEVAGKSIEAQTGRDGLIDQPIAANAADGTLTVWMDDKTKLVMKLNLGHLDPPDAISGAQSRLRNLGYDAGPTTGSSSARFEAALLGFQRKHGLAESGQLDDDTQGKLEEQHDQP
jgi:hypothetical protein